MNISLGSDGNFALTLPSGRTLSVPNTPHTAAFLYKLLWDASHMVKGREPKGYIGSFPTQAVADAWLRDAAKQRLSTSGIEVDFDI